jgi:hypothetical protein
VPQYLLTLVDKQGKQHIRNVTANDGAAAARTAEALTGWKCVSSQSVEEEPAKESQAKAPSGVPAPDVRPAAPKQLTRSYLMRTKRHPVTEFFDFRVMVSPFLVRAVFVLATAGLALLIMFSPMSYISEYNRLNAQRQQEIAKLQSEAKMGEELLSRLAPFENSVAEWTAERDKHAAEPDHRIAQREAEEKLTNLNRSIAALLRPMNVKTGEELRTYLASVDRQLQSMPPPQFPSVWPEAVRIGSAILIWIALRLALELYCVLFAIHERLSEIRDQRPRMA